MVQVFRCKICGEAFVANSKSTHCAFCGAPVKFLVDAKEYVEPEVPELSEISKKNLEFSFDLEVNAFKIYHCMRKKSKDEFIIGMMKTLSKVVLMNLLRSHDVIVNHCYVITIWVCRCNAELFEGFSLNRKHFFISNEFVGVHDISGH